MARKRKKEIDLFPGTMASMLTLVAMALLCLWLNDNYIHLDPIATHQRQWWTIPLLVIAIMFIAASSFISGMLIQKAYDRARQRQGTAKNLAKETN